MKKEKWIPREINFTSNVFFKKKREKRNFSWNKINEEEVEGHEHVHTYILFMFEKYFNKWKYHLISAV